MEGRGLPWHRGSVFEWFGGGVVAVFDGEVWYLVTHLASRTAHVTLIAHKNRGKVSGGVIRQVEGQLYRRTTIFHTNSNIMVGWLDCLLDLSTAHRYSRSTLTEVAELDDGFDHDTGIRPPMEN